MLKCSVHPSVPASWECHNCGGMFCSECILKREKSNFSKEKIYLCPKCVIPAISTGYTERVEPFWTKMHRFFLYPLSGTPLAIIIIISLLQFALKFIPFISIYFKIILAGMMVKYSFDVLQQTALGDMKPPGFRFDDLGKDIKPLIMQVFLFALVTIAIAWSLSKGTMAAITVSAVCILSLPAMIILVAATGSLFKALNPVYFGSLILRIGGGYFTMFLFLAFLLGAPAFIAARLGEIAPGWFIALVKTFTGTYYMIVMYHLMGYVMLQYSSEIGYDIDHEKMEAMASARNRRIIEKNSIGQPSANTLPAYSELKKRVEIHLREGNLDKAADEIRKSTDGKNIMDIELSASYHELLKMTGASSEAARHGESYLELLVDANDRKKGLEVFAFCIKADKNFSPSARILFKISGWLNEAGKHKPATQLLEKITRTFPDDPVTPQAYLRAAQIFHDGLLQKEKAVSLLDEMVRRFPDDSLITKAKKYREYIS